MANNAQLVSNDLSEEAVARPVGARVASLPRRAAPLKIVYIAGDGRSGSTLLDRLIGAYPGVFSCGELGNLLYCMNSAEEYCACNTLVKDCAFWKSVMRTWSTEVPGFSEAEYRRLQHRYERMRALFRPWNELSFGTREFARYAGYTRELFSAIADHSGAEVIVDSSKSPARALAIARVAGIDLRLLHLVRDVRGVAYSLRIPYREPPKEGRFANVKRRSHLRFAGTWALVNFFCERVRIRIPGPSLFIRYEDYAADPATALSRIGDLMGMPSISYDASAGHLLKQGHQVAGNDVRLRPVQAINPDEVWRHKFSHVMQKGLYFLVLPLMLRYRYRL